MSVINIKNALKRFSNKTLYRNLNIEVEKGELLILKGKNGCGKSTLLNIMAGLVRAEGKIEVETPLRYVSGTARVDDFLNLKQNVDLWLDKGVHTETVIKHWGLEEFQKMKGEHLSLGQKKRVLLARSLSNEASVYLLDEPLLHLDETWKEYLKKIVEEKLNKKSCVVIATHNSEYFSELVSEEIDLNEL